MKVLMGIDDSPHSQAAFDFAKAVPWPKDTHFELVSVLRPEVSAYSMVGVPSSGRAEALVGEETRLQVEMVARLARELRARGLDASASTLEGDPRVLLVDAARTRNVDLLVVGSHGRSGLSKLILGSVASHLVVHAPCSVLVVKRPLKI